MPLALNLPTECNCMEIIENYRIKILTGQYQKAPSEQRKMIQKLFGEQAEYHYEIYFHWYNVLHELGHAIMMFHASSRPHPAEEEQLVNHFAYAYWKHYGEQTKLEELRALVDKTVHKFTNPTHNNECYMDYAKRVWGTEELSSFNNYGWFQFSSVQAAISGAPSLEQVLNTMCSATILPQKAETLKYEICDHTAAQVLADAVRLMEDWGIRLPEHNEVVFCDDINCQMCRAENLLDGRVF